MNELRFNASSVIEERILISIFNDLKAKFHLSEDSLEQVIIKAYRERGDFLFKAYDLKRTENKHDIFYKDLSNQRIEIMKSIETSFLLRTKILQNMIGLDVDKVVAEQIIKSSFENAINREKARMFSDSPDMSDSLGFLIVDDADMMRLFLMQVIKSVDRYYLSQVSEEGADAITKFIHLDKNKSIAPFIVTLDIELPPCIYETTKGSKIIHGGIDVCEEISNLNPKALIIIISSFNDPELVKACMSAGAKGYIVKPFQKEEVIRQVNRFIDMDFLDERYRVKI